MTDKSQNPPVRLDSWKEIAAYLQRDERTVRRWERERGLPVRSVPGGRGRSVFAYTSEIDAWLTTASMTTEPAASSEPAPAFRTRWRGWLVVLPLTLVVVAMILRARPAVLTADDLRLEARPGAIVAFDAKGTERWRHTFSAAYRTEFPEPDGLFHVMTGTHPAVYVATAYRVRHSDGVQESGALTELDIEGNVQRSFSFTDEVTLHGTKYAAPWAITSFAVDDTGGARRIAVAAHHYIWDASLVTLLDDTWQRRGTFVHAGWVEALRWLAPNRLLIAGFSNAHNGGMVALLDPTAPGGIDGQGPEPPGTQYYCETCGTAAPPVRMIVLPRTEVNRVTASPFNRAVVQVTSGRIVARTIEVPAADREGVDALYEFSPSLDLVSATFSDRYWEIHRALEALGRLNHTREQCPDKDGPREIQMWEPKTGWRTQKIR